MTKLSAERVYDGTLVKVDVDLVRLPDGREIELEMIRHPGASAIVSIAALTSSPESWRGRNSSITVISARSFSASSRRPPSS